MGGLVACIKSFIIIKRRNSMAEYLFVNNATFSWRATLLQIIALSTTEAELMALASSCCEIVRRKHALELGFLQLKPTDVYEANTGCNTC